MSEASDDQLDRTTYEVALSTESLEITPADGIEIEEAENLKYLRFRSGDFQLLKAVFLIVQGRRIEITQDALPEDSQR